MATPPKCDVEEGTAVTSFAEGGSMGLKSSRKALCVEKRGNELVMGKPSQR